MADFSAQVDSPAAGRPSRAETVDTTDHLVRLGRLAYADGTGTSLTPTQWMVLRYLARANRFSRTVSAFADYHASTRGTASQTIKGLVQRGYLTRMKSDVDGRSVRLDLTARGRAALTADPCTRLEAAIASLPSNDLAAFEAQIRRLTDSVSAASRLPSFGTCRAGCRFLETGKADERASCRLRCAALAPEELDELCTDFAAA